MPNMPQQILIRMGVMFCLLQLFAIAAFAQVEKFDIITYTSPAGWAAKKGPDAVQFSKEDTATGAFCVVTIYKSVDAGTDSEANFNSAWNALVTQTLGIDAKPQIGAPGTKDGWATEAGIAPVSTAHINGAALLRT